MNTSRTNNTRQKNKHRHIHIPILLTALVGVALSLAAFFAARKWEEEKLRRDFERSAHSLVYEIEKEIEAHTLVVCSIGSLYDSSHKVERIEFREFVKFFLSRHPDIRSLAWIPLVPDSMRAEYEEAARQDGLADFQITRSDSAGKGVRADQRNEYFPVYFVEPHADNAAALGFDLGSSIKHLEMLSHAAKTGQMAAAGRSGLPLEKGTRSAVLILHPVYRKARPLDSIEDHRANLSGFVAGVFEIPDILKGALERLEPGGIDIYLYDESAPPGRRFLSAYESSTGKIVSVLSDAPGAGLHYDAVVDVSGLKLSLRCVATPELIAASRSWQPLAVLLSTVLLTSLFAGYLLSGIRHTDRAERLVEEMIRQAEQRRRAEEEIHMSYQSQVLMNSFLQFSFGNVSIDEILQLFLSKITSLPWLGLQTKGAVFMVEDDPAVLVMRSHYGLDTRLHALCARVPFGKCLCGRAAASGEIQFVDCVNESHDIRYDGMPPHAHYCIPLMYGNKVAGVVTLYMNEGHRGSRNQEEFLCSASDMLAGVLRRKAAEKALAESQAQHRDLVETITDWIWEVDAKGVYSYVSPRVRDILGYEPQEVLGKTPFDLMSHEEAERVSGIFRALVAKQQPLIAIENTNIHKDGHPVMLETNGRPFFDADGALLGYRGVDRDITERKGTEEARRDLERQLLQSEKMASVGQLAAGIAHEINNPTGFVSSNLNTLKGYNDDLGRLLAMQEGLITNLADLNLPSSLAQQAEQIEAVKREIDLDFILADMPKLIGDCQEGTERIKKIVIDLKDFAHPGEDRPQFADINQGLDSTLNVVWNELKYKATVSKDYGELPRVLCYPHQLNQVFMNILVNAAQAIEKQGEIKITTRAVNGKVQVAISDTGAGIPKEVLPKIFDPFFTTKEVGKGTGLGLNVAYNIVNRHNGSIDVESEVGKGTTFTIKIPVGSGDEDHV